MNEKSFIAIIYIQAIDVKIFIQASSQFSILSRTDESSVLLNLLNCLTHLWYQPIYKVNRCLARYSPRKKHLICVVFWSAMGPNGPEWANLAVYGPKVLFLVGVSKRFGIHIIVFWLGIGSNGPKKPIFGQKCKFWAKFGRFWANNPIIWGEGVKLLLPSYQKTNATPFSC